MFSKSTEYALRALVYLAQKSSKEQKIGITELSEAVGSPKSFTAKVLQKLTQGNDSFVSSVTGPSGGFYLSDHAKKQSLLEVLKILDDEKMITGCVLGLSECSRQNPCPMHSEYTKVKAQLLDLFDRKSLAELASEMNDPKIVINNIRSKDHA